MMKIKKWIKGVVFTTPFILVVSPYVISKDKIIESVIYNSRISEEDIVLNVPNEWNSNLDINIEHSTILINFNKQDFTSADDFEYREEHDREDLLPYGIIRRNINDYTIEMTKHYFQAYDVAIDESNPANYIVGALFWNNKAKENVKNTIKNRLTKYNSNIFDRKIKSLDIITQHTESGNNHAVVLDANTLTLKIKLEYKRKDEYKNILTTEWDRWRSVLAPINKLEIKTDYGGLISQNADQNDLNNGSKNNTYYLDEYINNINRQNPFIGTKLVYQINNDGENVDIYVRQKRSNQQALIVRKKKIRWIYTDRFWQKDYESRLQFIYGKWVDFNTKTTSLVDDVPIRDPNDNKSLGTNRKSPKDKRPGSRRWGGRWIVHTPLKVSFNTIRENEVLLINGKKIEVLDKQFIENLVDLRTNAKDDERVLDYGVMLEEDETMDETNSHAKNEYKIQILKYANNKNLENELVEIYEKVLVIDSKSSQEDFIWYAWDPQNNPNQKELIEEFLLDKENKIKADDKGNPIRNPKYDPNIDKTTGTKKQVVLMDFSIYKNNLMGNVGKNDELRSFSKFYSNKSDKEYYNKTKLPYGTKFLFAPHNEENFKPLVIAEAIVLGKGGLKKLIGKNEKFTLFKLKNNSNYLEFEKFLHSDGTTRKEYEELDPKVSDFSYFSESGIWLFASNAENSISNFKIILIEEKTSPQSYFLDNVKFSSKQIQDLWKTRFGIKLYNFIYKQIKNEEQILNMKYEEVMEYYKQFINEIYFIDKYNDFISITPSFVELPKDHYDETTFNQKYNSNPNEFKKYFSDFKHKDKVDLQSVELIDNNSKVKIGLALNTSESIYQLSTYEVIKDIKLLGVADDTNNPRQKTIINLSIDDRYIKTIASQNEKERFLIELSNNKQRLFSNLSDTDFQKLNIDLEFIELNNNLKITVNLKSNFIDDYQIQPANEFNIIVNLYNNIAENDISGNEIVDIFQTILPFEINLKGIKGIDLIKQEIIKQLELKIKNLKYDVDYHATNLDIVANERSYVNIGIENRDNVFSVLNLVAKKPQQSGVLKIKVFNYVNRLLDNDIDLSKIKFNKLVLNDKFRSAIVNNIKTTIESKLQEFNLEWNKDYLVNNFWEGIDALSLGGGNVFKFNIVGTSPQIKNQTSLIASNDAIKVYDDIKNPNITEEESFKYDLHKINFELEQTKEYVMSKLRQDIYDKSIKYIYDNYGIKVKQHYYFDLEELNSVVRRLVQKNNIINKDLLSINPISEYSYNNGRINLSNLNDSYDPIDDLETNKLVEKEIINGEAKDPLEILNNNEKQRSLLIFIPLGVIILFIIVLIVLLIYIRKFKKKVK